MFQLVIADDEKPIRDGLATVDWQSLGFAVRGVVSNGEKALALVEQGGIDTVLVDIRMPIMTGLQLAEILHERYPAVCVVLLTGYNDFDYAKSAIAYGVYRYLVKPIDVGELMETFRALAGMLGSRKKSSAELYALQQIGAQSVLHRIAIGELMDLDIIEQRLAEVEVTVQGRQVFCCLYSGKPALFEDFVRALRACAQRMNAVPACYPLHIGDARVVVFLQPEANTAREQIRRLIEGCLPPDSCACLSEGKEHPVFIGALYAQVLAAARKSRCCGELVLLASARETDENRSLGYPHALDKQLTDAVLYGEPEDVAALFDRYAGELRRSYEPTAPAFVPNVVEVYLAALASRLKNLGFSPDLLSAAAENVHGAAYFSPALAWQVSQVLATACRQVKGEFAVLENHAVFPVAEIRRYIQRHCNGKITLDQVAREFSFAPSYVSACFKKLTGKNFIEYVKECRIELAKLLLQDTNKRIYQIGAEVGYENNQYFNDMFKESVGCTPQKYRLSHRGV